MSTHSVHLTGQCLVAAFCALVLSASVQPADGAWSHMPDSTAAPDSTMRILVPAYFDPAGSDEWDLLVTESAAMPGRICAIADRNDGPGPSYDSAYAHAIARMHTSTGRVIGYVYTDYGATPPATAKADIDKWYSFYPSIDGIFLDCQAYQTGHEAYYVDLYNYIKQKNSSALVVSNPGINTLESYLVGNGQRASDVICIFENGSGFEGWTPSSWCSKYPDSSWCVLPYNTSWGGFPDRVRRAVALNIGWIYCTDGTLPNPWSALPPYFEAFCRFLRTGEVVAPPPTGQTAVTIDGHFSDWNGVPPLNTPPNPAPGGSPFPDAGFVNVWATNDTTNLYVSYQVAGALKESDYFYHVFLDVDGDTLATKSGYVYNDSAAIGAEFMVEGNYFYRYTGSGGGAWSWGSAAGMVKSDSAGRTELSIPLHVLFQNARREKVQLLFQSTLAVSPYTRMCVAPADYANQSYIYPLTRLTTGIQKHVRELPPFALSQNFPNPFNPSTVIEYSLAKTEPVRIDVFDLLGRHVSTVVEGIQAPGVHRAQFDAGNLASGVYFYVLRADGYRAVRHMLIEK